MGEQGATTVYIGTQICETIEYYSSDTQLACLTPAVNTNVDLSVLIKVKTSSNSHCPLN